jgi:hypothetical protein
MQPDEPPSPIMFRGRDRAPSGPCLADAALSEKSLTSEVCG